MPPAGSEPYPPMRHPFVSSAGIKTLSCSIPSTVTTNLSYCQNFPCQRIRSSLLVSTILCQHQFTAGDQLIKNSLNSSFSRFSTENTIQTFELHRPMVLLFNKSQAHFLLAKKTLSILVTSSCFYSIFLYRLHLRHPQKSLHEAFIYLHGFCFIPSIKNKRNTPKGVFSFIHCCTGSI